MMYNCFDMGRSHLIATALIAALGPRSTTKIGTATVFLTCALIAFYSILTVRQNAYWSDPLRFYKETLKYAPRSVRVHNDMGIELNERGE